MPIRIDNQIFDMCWEHFVQSETAFEANNHSAVDESLKFQSRKEVYETNIGKMLEKLSKAESIKALMD